MDIPCKFTTLGVNEGSKLCGIHHDPPSPLPALIAGNTTWVYDMLAHAWRQECGGGRFFLADGLFDLSYGPRDVIILDGRFAHGVTTLRELPGVCRGISMVSRPELWRFSYILFSRWLRQHMVCERTMRSQPSMSRWRQEWYRSVMWQDWATPRDTSGEGVRKRKAPTRLITE